MGLEPKGSSKNPRSHANIARSRVDIGSALFFSCCLKKPTLRQKRSNQPARAIIFPAPWFCAGFASRHGCYHAFPQEKGRCGLVSYRVR
jgi:hypothetical protein